MKCLLLASLFAVSLSVTLAQPASPPLDASLQGILGFEAPAAADMPGGWRGGPRETLHHDGSVVHGGKAAARIERGATEAKPFSTFTLSLPLTFAGKQIQLRGYLKTENVTGSSTFWLREDVDGEPQEFTNLGDHALTKTNEWQEYVVSLPLNPRAQNVVLGILQSGSGKTWADDLQLLVDGQPVWLAPKAAPAPTTALGRDHEFDAGSKIKLRDLTPIQVANLALLGKVWGFLKYHHPVITQGGRHWDYELFRIAPAILGAPDARAARAILVQWIDTLGRISPVTETKNAQKDPAFGADNDWLKNEAALGPELSRRLQAVQAGRSRTEKQFYVSLTPGVSNPVFENERPYSEMALPDSGYQLLALFRYWNIVRYWFPYRDRIDGKWDDVLTEFIPRVGLTTTVPDYQRELLALVTRVGDTHANLWSGLETLPPTGPGVLPARFRFVEGRAVVTETWPEADKPSLLQRGDVILSLDGRPLAEMLREWSPYYAASNEATRLRDLARFMGRGAPGPVKLEIERNGTVLTINADRVPINPERLYRLPSHDRAGPVFQMLGKEVAYLKLSGVKAADSAHYVEQATGTKGWIIDIRNYPSEFVVFQLGSLLAAHDVPFVRFTNANPANPGEFNFGAPLVLPAKAPHYAGQVVVLIDETSQSQAEYTAMAFRAAGAFVIGSTTAGADGNISPIGLPGGQSTMISGIGVFYPDKLPTQRIGIVPDAQVTPTLDGIRNDRDEVLEAAVRHILGAAAGDEAVRAAVAPAESR